MTCNLKITLCIFVKIVAWEISYKFICMLKINLHRITPLMFKVLAKHLSLKVLLEMYLAHTTKQFGREQTARETHLRLVSWHLIFVLALGGHLSLLRGSFLSINSSQTVSSFGNKKRPGY